MKKWMMYLLFVYVLASVVSASVVVHNFSIEDAYSPFEIIRGDINLTIIGENYNSKITSNNNDEIEVGDFLSKSGVLFECSPPDCSNDYSFFDGVADKSFRIHAAGKKYMGFILDGENIVLDSLNFKVESNFKESSRSPLSIEFFEKKDWRFNEFSDLLLLKDWGCYDSIRGTQGPLIGNSFYCEMISIPNSGTLNIGASVSGIDTTELNMVVYPETGTGASWECSYNPNSDESCLISPDIGEIFSAGNYQVCVGSDILTGYRIYQEDIGDNCGFGYVSGPEGSVKDYAIFVQAAKYASADFLDDVDFNKEDIIEAANLLILKKYEGDCSNGGCILPFAISGVAQDARIYDVQLTYTSDLEWDSTSEIYDLDVTPVTVDFNGVLDLSTLGFIVSKTMDYIVSFNEADFFNASINVLPAPIILLLFPQNPPAGVPIKFNVGVQFEGNNSLSYKWDFGDDETAVTNLPFTFHSYPDLKNYTMVLEVSAGGNLTSAKSFDIETISPEVAINTTLISKRSALESIVSNIESFPFWYSEALMKIIGVVSFESELDRLDRARNNSFIEQDFIKVAEELYALNIPVGIGVNSFNVSFLMTKVEDINTEPVAIISGDINKDNNKGYANFILNWQNENIDVNFETKEFIVSMWDRESNGIFRVYNFEVSSKDSRESYFVINRPFNDLYFKEDIGARKAGDSTIIILEPESKKSFEFYYKSAEPTTFFVSPKLSSIVIDADIDTTCNFNLICEKEYGENPDNCRSDCKPVGRAIIYLILSLLFILIIYSVLQIWYKHCYENYLFRDDRQLYNLLMYVTNARARGMKDLRIGAELRSKGWSSERVNYIIKKSRGDRTGMYEIIPFEKVLAYFRNRKAREDVLAKVNTVTGNRQQMGRNINKSGFQRRV